MYGSIFCSNNIRRDCLENYENAINYAQHVSLFSQLQNSGSFRQDGQMMVPHPTQVLLNLLQPQCSQSSIQQFYHYYIITLSLIRCGLPHKQRFLLLCCTLFYHFIFITVCFGAFFFSFPSLASLWLWWLLFPLSLFACLHVPLLLNKLKSSITNPSSDDGYLF